MKHEKILMLLLLFFTYFLLPINMLACTNPNGCISADSGGTNQSHNPTTPANKNQLQTSGDRSYMKMTNKLTGEDIYIVNNEDEKNKLVNCGFASCLDESQIKTFADLGLDGKVDMYNQNTQDELTKMFDEMKADFVDENGKINSNSKYTDFFRAIYGDDLEAATQKLIEEGNLIDLLFYPGYIMYDPDPVTGGIKFLDGSTTEQFKSWCLSHPDCQKMCEKVNASSDYFNDNGILTPNELKSCVGKYVIKGYSTTEANKQCCIDDGGDEWGSCCLLFHSPKECFEHDEPTPDESECSYNPEIPVKKPGPTPNSSYSTGGTCGGTYISVQYDYSETIAGGYVTVEKETYTVIQLPSIKKNVFAGQGVNWRDITSNKTITKRVHDQTRLDYEIESANAIIINNERLIGMLECQKGKEEEKLKALNDLLNEKLNDCNENCDYCRDCTGELSSEEMTACEKENEGCEEAELACETRVDDCKKTVRNIIQPEINSCNKNITEIEKNIGIAKNDPAVVQAKNRLVELEKYSAEVSSYGIKIQTYTDTASSSNEVMNIGKYSQKMNSIVAIAKNSGFPLTQADLRNIDNGAFITNSYDFFIPSTIKNNSNGIVSRYVRDSGIGFTYQCDLNVTNFIKNNGGINLIYRPISLTNPFPNIQSNGGFRKLGANWDYSLAETYILNNRNVSDYDVYNMTPLYTITLTPTTIKEIRKYNKKNSYNDFDMYCDSGYKCISEFLWNSEFTKIIDQNNSCASSNGWLACYGGDNG